MKISVQDEKFSERVLKKLFVLNYAPNGMWTYLVSVYFMQYKDDDGLLNEEKFYGFLDKITAFIFGYAFIRPGVNALRSPVYPKTLNYSFLLKSFHFPVVSLNKYVLFLNLKKIM